MTFDPYTILEIPRAATPEQIKAAYRQKALEYHPDKVAHLGSKIRAVADEEMKQINAANDILSDAAKRAAYDRSSAKSAPRTPPRSSPPPPAPRPSAPPRPSPPPPPPPPRDPGYSRPSSRRAEQRPQPPPRRRGVLPPAGSTLTHSDRTGRTATATVTDRGIEFRGQIYTSMSSAAVAAAKSLGSTTTALNGNVYWTVTPPGTKGGSR